MRSTVARVKSYASLEGLATLIGRFPQPHGWDDLLGSERGQDAPIFLGVAHAAGIAGKQIPEAGIRITLHELAETGLQPRPIQRSRSWEQSFLVHENLQARVQGVAFQFRLPGRPRRDEVLDRLGASA